MSTEIIQKPLTAAYQEPQPSRETHHNAHQPCVRSRLTARLHPRTSIVIAQTQSYFLSNWPFQSEDAREAFKTSDVLSFGCFVASSALDDRIALSCSLFASLFLIDGSYTKPPPCIIYTAARFQLTLSDLIDTSGGRSDARHLFRAFPGLIVGDPNVQPVSKLEKVVSELFSKIRETGEQGHGFCVDTLAWFKATMGEDRDKCQKTSIEEYLKYRIIDAGYWYVREGTHGVFEIITDI